ncbi:hypothetical protein [Saccharicrinis sp. 156]|uniref:hypothetical protein n=1 Tax=Saccharicrinis sp. 156 TaxID=3417574 RepID=UPI003D3411D8
MKETIDAAFSMINIIPTVLLILILIYWLTVIVGVFNVDSFDIDADADVDIDVDVEADIDMSAADSILWVNSALAFFNLGKIPFMLLLSFFALSLWVISMLMNYHLNNESVLLSLVYLIPNVFVSAFITKLITSPFVKLFAKAESDIESNRKLTGKMCLVTLSATHNKMGQAEIKIEGSSFIINVMSTEEKYSLRKGDSCLVIDYIPEKKIYLIEPYKN